MNPKIDIYVNGNYQCSTNQSKSCAEAKRKFLANPCYMSVGGFYKLDPRAIHKVECKFAEEK